LVDLTRREAFAGIPRKHADLMIGFLEKIQSNFASLEPLQPASPVAPLRSAPVATGAVEVRRGRTTPQP
jgi:hypothetical protein